jgi:hypothetical protein
LNDFRLAISIEELQKYGDRLLKHWVMEEEMRQGGGMYDNMRFPNGHGSISRWDSGHSFEKSLSKRSRKFPSTDDTTSKGGGSKAMKEEDQIEHNHHIIRSHRRDSSFSSTKSLNITSSYQSTLTSSPQQYSTHLSKTPPPPPLSGSSPSMVSTSSGNLPNSINNSPMHAPFASSSVFNTHHPVYHHLHKPYPHHPHHQSQHHRSMSLGSTIKRANSSGSLLSRAKSGDLSDDLQQYHHPRHSSPKPMNPEDHAYRTAAAPPYPSAPPPTISSTPTLSIPTSKSINGNRNCPQPSPNNNTLPTPSPTHNITNLMRRMSHDSPSNPFQYPPPSYHYPAYPPAPSTQSLPTTPVSTLPPPLGIPFNTATISNAIGYARRASLALLPLPRHLSGFASSNIPSTVPSENLSPGPVRRGSVPTTWSGSSLTNGNGSSNSSSNLAMGNGSSSLSISSVPISSSSSSGKPNSIMNGHGHNHIHTNGVSTTPHGTSTTEISKRGSWVMINNNLSNHGLYNHNNHHGQHHNSHNNHHNHQHNHQHLQSHGHGNASRSSSSDSCHSSSTTGSNSGTASDSGLSTPIPVPRMTTSGDGNSNINGANNMNKPREN